MQPRTYVAYSPDRSGSVFALFYCGGGGSLHGWHVEAREPYFSSAFFMMENLYSSEPLHMYRSVQDDVYGPWTIDSPPVPDRIRCPLPDAACHDLERLQSDFVDDWLVFREDCRHPSVRVKPRRLGRMQRCGDAWVYATPGLDETVVQLVRRYWRLNEKLRLH
ncbi:MAG TPA: hypothetical protein VM406_02875 [Noviherbaspirillum sp.]|nr:hypothetical protein [Noviherbaspirillum sp.]